MRLKSYTSQTIAGAMAQIREELGDDAIIVASRGDGEGGVRVTAAIDEAVLAERARLRAARDAIDKAASIEPTIDVAYRAMKDNGVPVAIGEAILDLIAGFETTDPVRALAAALRQTFRFDPLDEMTQKTPLMLVGPPGAGKTQTAVKLAARAMVENHTVALMSCDTGRAGGLLPLAAFAHALKMEVVAVSDPSALAAGLRDAADRDLTVIDGPGRNHLNTREMVELGRYIVAGRVEPLLILPAGLDPIGAADIAGSYADVGARRMIVTRIDLTRRLGSVLAAAFAAGIAFAETSDTNAIRDGLMPATPMNLARLLLPGRIPAPENALATARQ
ncbi:MAG: GTPase [Inquilinaceae bacterium]